MLPYTGNNQHYCVAGEPTIDFSSPGSALITTFQMYDTKICDRGRSPAAQTGDVDLVVQAQRQRDRVRAAL
jgi:hypothetical protein